MKQLLNSVAKRKEQRIERRVLAEREFKIFSGNIQLIDPKLLEGIDIPEDLSAKGLLPSLYEERPDPEKYKEEYALAVSLFEKITEVKARLMAEAEKEAESYEY